MISFVSALVALLCLVSGNGAQRFGQCDYTENVVPGKQYFIFNPGWPRFYKPGTSCRWTAKSDRQMMITCNPFDLPVDDQCELDAVTVHDSSEAIGHRYCGMGPFTFVSRSNRMSLEYRSTDFSPGGRFYCKLETIDKDDTSNQCRCGWKNPSRIVDGEETGINEYPMMAGLVDANLTMVYCGATIINERQVLTAAHCVATRRLASLGVLVGDHNLASADETNATKLYRVEDIRIYPGYNAETRVFDLALLTIRGRMQFNQQVGPVCLPFAHSRDNFAGSLVEVLGWGSTTFAGRISNTLQRARLSVLANSECTRTFPDINPRQLCTYGERKDSCQFDSGGPVLWQNPNTRRLVEVGIISVGGACGIGEPAVNARLGAYIEWIVANTPNGISYCRVE